MSFDCTKQFLAEESCPLEESSVVILPVPYDGTSTWIKGADKGPAALIEASANLEFYDIETDFQPCTVGVFTDAAIMESSSPEAMTDAVYRRTAQHLADSRMSVVIGGEHSVSVGAIRAYAKTFPDLTILQLDAHSDLRNVYEGSEYNHACVMARAREKCPIVQVGIRSMDISEKTNMDPSRVFFAKDIHGRSDWVDPLVERLTDNVYITIDLDVFDPSVLPATGTPEPGGMLWYDVLALLRAVIEKRCLVGFDVVELCPIENNRASEFLAAKLIHKILAYKYST